jgi:hypothetical protein
MDDFSKYIAMRERGDSPRAVYAAAKADGFDEITLIRLIRRVFGLSLAQVKEVTGASDALNAGQVVQPGAKVYWEAWDSLEGFSFMEARVRAVHEGIADLTDHRKYQMTPEGFREVPIQGPVLSSVRASYFEKPLAERIIALIQFLGGLADLEDSLSGERKREAV